MKVEYYPNPNYDYEFLVPVEHNDKTIYFQFTDGFEADLFASKEKSYVIHNVRIQGRKKHESRD